MCFYLRFHRKASYYTHTINGALTQLRQIDKVIQTEPIPSITGGITCDKNEIKLLSVPPKLGGLWIPIFAESYQVEYKNSVKLTEGHCTKIINQTQ